MRMSRGWWIVTGSLWVVAACQPQPAPTPYRPTSTVKEIMQSMVDPSSKILWDSVATNIGEAGAKEKAPQNDEEWAVVRHQAVVLMEATNLLVMPGRHVAPPGAKSDKPEVELAPEKIEEIVNQDLATWVKLAHGLHDTAAVALKAIDAKNAEELSNAGGDIDMACESCHLKHWYPEKKPG